ncbi:cobalt-precorrin-6A reductase [Chroococcidiopsis thermalis]|uniref:Precorrin-6A reductase n=1 Tax=Chroococcidiopsis thermalis (strain PCC 7203) TaxID=251229 RepID=K9U2I7_CHRTP|nr:cobalt-precorrin-6A reductase [Chroococcidiopsis thermalis]AFY88833.1 precorrin-6A reductase [Chroococcidiopsis thermalis PCC 7203]
MMERRQKGDKEDKGDKGEIHSQIRNLKSKISLTPQRQIFQVEEPQERTGSSSLLTPLWLIGGTQESAQLAEAIARANLPCIISVTTESARALYPDAACLQVRVGRFTCLEIEAFVQQQGIIGVLDASHPYAVEISQSAIAVCQKLGIPYLRYERPVFKGVGTGWELGAEERIDGFESLLSGDYLQGQRVLLTVGYRPLHLFQSWQDKATLFARILPSAIALESALKAGFANDRLICLRPPISAALEAALWRQWNISVVVTKASGAPGGEDVKRTVAAELGIDLITIARPNIEYPQQTSDLSVALDFCRMLFG